MAADDKSDGEMEMAPLLPLFEVELDLAKPEGALRKVKVDVDSGVHLRCKVAGEIHQKPGLQWFFSGSELSTKDDHQIDIDHKNLVSNLKINRVESGIYECGVTSKADGKLHRRRLKLIPKPVAVNRTSFGEVLCGPEKEGYCQHGGICLYHPGTKVLSCQCHPHTYGMHCEYISAGGPSATVIITQEQYNKTITLVAGLAGVVILAMMLAFFIYVRKGDQIKSRFRRRSKTPPEIITSGPSCAETSDTHFGSATLEPTSQSPVTWKLEERIKLIRALLPARCPHCKRTLGISAKLDALSRHGSINSTPPMLVYPHLDPPTAHTIGTASVVRSVSDSPFHSPQSTDTPQTHLLQPTQSFKERKPNRPHSTSALISPSVHVKLESESSVDGGTSLPDEGPPRRQPHVGLVIPGIIREISTDENGQGQTESTALLDAFQAYRAQNTSARVVNACSY